MCHYFTGVLFNSSLSGSLVLRLPLPGKLTFIPLSRKETHPDTLELTPGEEMKQRYIPICQFLYIVSYCLHLSGINHFEAYGNTNYAYNTKGRQCSEPELKTPRWV